MLHQSSSKATIQEVNLEHTANFESDATCLQLITLIDTAPCFKKLNIKNQHGERSVEVSIEHAVPANDEGSADAPKPGFIEVKAKKEAKVIWKVPTNKTDSSKVEILNN